MKHPERTQQLAGPRLRTRRSRWLLGPLVAAPPAMSWPLRAGAAWLMRAGLERAWFRKLFWSVRTLEHLRGVRAARRALSTGQAVVLAYHAIADLHDDPVLAKYGVPRARFAGHLDTLSRHGWTFIDLDALLGALEGERHLPARAVLVTFDDAYVDLRSTACPLLAERAVPAVVFAVTGRVGGTNEWDRAIGAATHELLDRDGLRAVATQGVEIGSHSESHRPLPQVPPDELEVELAESAAQLQALGIPRPRAFAYPHGAWTAELAEAVQQAGYAVAFTVDAGVVRRETSRHALPRIQVEAGDTPRKLRIKVVTAGWPEPWRRRSWRLLRA